jgi:hypothetical protein
MLLRLACNHHPNAYRSFGTHSILDFWLLKNRSFTTFMTMSNLTTTPWITQALDLAFVMTSLEQSRRPLCEHLLAYHSFLNEDNHQVQE